MNPRLKITSVVVSMLMLISGCTSQIYGQNFDQVKAAKTRVSLGLTYLKNGNFRQAKFNLDKALNFAPRSADANFAMAYYYQSVSELELAEKAYQFAMNLEPKNANIANSYGAFLCQNGNYEKAKEYFLKAVNTSNYASSAETYENLALCSQNQEQPEDTIQYLRSAVNHQPGRASSLYFLAQSLVEVQQWQEAKTILSRYEKTSQISPQSLSLAIQIESGMGNESAVKSYMDMLIMLFPNNPMTKKIIVNQQPSSATITALSSPAIPEKIVIIENISKPAVLQPTIQLPSLGKNEPVTNKPTVIVEDDNVTQVELDLLDKVNFHIVAEGENLYRISLLYNIKMQRLIDWNALVDASAIFDGKKLSLVAPSAVE
jgi:type IV pilus assembly protein PilF